MGRRAGDAGAGPRTEQDIQSALAKGVTAERWTWLDLTPRQAADANGGMVDLWPGAPNEDVTCGCT